MGAKQVSEKIEMLCGECGVPISEWCEHVTILLSDSSQPAHEPIVEDSFHDRMIAENEQLRVDLQDDVITVLRADLDRANKEIAKKTEDYERMWSALQAESTAHAEVRGELRADLDRANAEIERLLQAALAALDKATTPPSEATERSAMTKKEFEVRYAQQSGVTVGWLLEHGRRVESCDCEQATCRGWQMIYVCDHPGAERSGMGGQP